MKMIDKLNENSSSLDSLSNFIKKNIHDLYDYFVNQNHARLKLERNKIESFLETRNKVIKKLDYSLSANQIFIDLLIDVSERLHLSIFFRNLLRIKSKSSLEISSRQQASVLCISHIIEFEDYNNIIDELLDKLESAFKEEEDNDKRVLFVFLNLYSRIIRDYGKGLFKEVVIFVDRLKYKREKYLFLRNKVVDDIFALNIAETESTYLSIHSILDKFLGRKEILTFVCDTNYVIEKDTKYAEKIALSNKDIYQIRKVSIELYEDRDTTYNSLGRGVTVLTETQQLYAYMLSFGKMHFAKCNSAFEKLPSEFYNKSIEIIDWGAGQALASMSYLDYLNKSSITQDIMSFTISEPSEIAIKRGTLHIKKYRDSVDVRTINRYLDNVESSDFKDITNNANLHLFSNILDIDDFSMGKLLELISSSFKGENYFVVVSPYITDLKKNRIDSFVDYFRKYKTFEHIAHENNRANDWCDHGSDSWSRILRIFKVIL